MDGAEPLVQAQPGGAQRRAAVIRERAADGEAIAARRGGCGVVPARQRALEGPHPAHRLLELHLGAAVGREDRLGRLAQVVELAELVRHAGQRARDGVAEGRLPVGDHPGDGHRQRPRHLAQQRGQVVLGGPQQAPRQQDLARQALAQHPEDVGPHVRLQAVERQDDPLLGGQPLSQAGGIAEAEGDQLLVAGEGIGDAALGDGHAAPDERAVDPRHAAVLGEAQRPDQRDDVQPELAVRQGPAPLLLRPVGLPVPRAGRVGAAAHDEGRPAAPVEGGDGAGVMVGHPRGAATAGTPARVGLEPERARRGGTGLAAGHRGPPDRRGGASGAQHTTRKPSSPAQEKKAIEAIRDELRAGDAFSYADECNVSWWSPKGQQVLVPTPGQPARRYGIGAVNDHTGETVVRFERRKRRQEMARLLEALLDNHPTGTVYVAWDNVATHADIELLWRHFRREVTHCELFETVAALLAAAADFFARHNREPQRTLSIIGSNAAIVV